MPRKFVTLITAAMIILTGCGPQIREPRRVCPGKESVDESLYFLQVYAHNTKPLKAHGQCLAEFYADGKQHKENFPVRLWFNPPAQIRLHGDIFLNPRGIILGSNEREFWLALKPKEISTYQWGLWSEQNSSETVMISPKTLLEALGIVAVGSGEGWSLRNEGAFDVLTRRNHRGRIIKRVYIHSCDYRVFKIEYFNADGKIVAVAGLCEYKRISEGFFVPHVIRIVTYAKEGCEDSVIITLRSVKPYKFDPKKQDVYFKRREPRGFKHIYKVVDGRMIEQLQ